jgi:deferrochelatase/peroxidase EfeB
MDTKLDEIIVSSHSKNSTGNPKKRPDWMYDGTFLVFRKLEQHVDRFEKLVKDASKKTGDTPELVKAKLMGRHPDGRL